MAIPDEAILQFFRRTLGQYVSGQNINEAGDVWSLQPLLYFLAYSIKAEILIEIGVADGSSTIPMLKAAEESLSGNGILHSIDPSGCEPAKALVKKLDAESHWNFHQVKSDQFFAGFNDKICFAFIDGDHAFPQVAHDVENCCSRLRDGGMIIISDFNSSRGSDKWINPEVYTKQTNYEIQCQNGIFKGVHLVMHKFPHLSAVFLADRSNASLMISYNYNYPR